MSHALAETLETRRLFDTIVDLGPGDSAPLPSFANGILTLTANNNSNRQTIGMSDQGQVTVIYAISQIDGHPFIQTYSESAAAVIFDGALGDDTLIVDPSFKLPITVLGGAGRDTLIAAARHVTLDGGADKDSLLGSKYADMLTGGGGHDTILAGAGNDTLAGAAGNDTLVGALGDDTILGGDNEDTLSGGDGADYLDAQLGFDLIAKGPTDFVVTAPADNDRIITPQDLILYDEVYFTSLTLRGTFMYGMTPKFTNVAVTLVDSLPTQIGSDQLAYFHNGGNFVPLKLGAAASMDLSTVPDPSQIFAGPYLRFSDAGPDRGHLLFITYTIVNRLHIAPFGPYGSPSAHDPHFPVSIKIDGALGHLRYSTTLIGSDYPDSIRGGSGRDSIIGGGSADTLDGAAGTDTIQGNAGNDYLIGGSGAGDMLIGNYSWDSDFYKAADTRGNRDTIIGHAEDRILTRDEDDIFIARGPDED